MPRTTLNTSKEVDETGFAALTNLFTELGGKSKGKGKFKPLTGSSGSSGSKGAEPMALQDKGHKCRLPKAAKMEAEELLVKARSVMTKYTKDAEKMLGHLSPGDALYGRLTLYLQPVTSNSLLEVVILLEVTNLFDTVYLSIK